MATRPRDLRRRAAARAAVPSRFPNDAPPAETPAPAPSDRPLEFGDGAPLPTSYAIPARPDDAARMFTLPVTADDKLIPDALTDKKRERLRTIVSDPEFGRVIGFPIAAAPPAAPLDPSMVGVLYDTLSTLMMGVARMRGIPPHAAGALAFTADEKTLLAEPTARVLAKYTTEFKYQDELVLGVAVLSLVAAKLEMMRQLAATPVPAAPAA